MAFPSSSGTTQDDLAIAWQRARANAGAVKNAATNLRAASLAGNVGSSAILNFATALADMKVALQRSAAVGGIAAYAQQQINDDTLNVVTEFNNMMAQIDAVTSWIITNFPKDGSGFLLAASFNPDNSGRTQDRQFSTAQLATFRTALDGLIATIN